MADKKISELGTAAAVYDADDFALVQDGDTKQVNASTVKAYVKDGLSKSDVGLGNVDNTSDANKNSATATLTNKTISGSSNTLSNIGNSSLTNSSITINGNTVSLGGSTTVSAATTNTLTIGTGLSGTSFNGSSATTIAIDSSVVTLTDAQTLTNKTLISPAISGGTANNVAIGGTTPAAGSFTTLSSTGNTTLGDASADTLTINGTAVSAPNGLNVNSNQLVLSGGNLGLGVTPSGSWFSGSRVFQFGAVGALWTNGSTNTAISHNAIFSDATTTYQTTGPASYYRQLDGTHNWFTAPSGTAGNAISFVQDMTLTSKGLLVGYTSDSSLSGTGNAIFDGNVGIGTNSPGVKLDVVGSIRATQSLNVGTGGTYAAGSIYSDSQWGMIFRATQPSPTQAQFRWATSADSELMRLDSSGNLGLGVTPSGWDSNQKVLQIASGAFYGYNNGVVVASNSYYNSGWKYINTAFASYYTQLAGQHLWYTSGTSPGTVGATVPFTQAMTLDASGRLIVGDTSSDTKLKISDTASAKIRLSGGSLQNGIFFSAVNTAPQMYIGAGNDLVVGGDKGFVIFDNTAGTYRFYIDYTGYVRIQNLSGSGSRSVNADSNGVLSAASDSRLKQEVANAQLPGLSEILNLQPKAYKWLKDIEQRKENAATEIGFFADEVAPVIPSAAPLCDDGMYGLYDRSITAALVKAVQELHAEIELLKTKVN